MNIKNSTQARFALVPLSFIFAVALAGCGGGGGGSSGTAASVTPVVGSSGNALPTAVRQSAHTQAAGMAAAQATPRSGSVTQTSNVASMVTQDSISATVTSSSSGLVVTATHTAADGTTQTTIDTSTDTARDNPEDTTGSGSDRTYRKFEVSKGTDAGDTSNDIYVTLYTTPLGAASTDYLVFGTWVEVPNNANPTGADTTRGFYIGAFADGPNGSLTPATYISATSSATYTGDAAGLYLQNDPDVGNFYGDVSLTAAFGSTPTISGRVSNIMVRDLDDPDFELLGTSAAPANLMLESATIGSANGGFFTGDTSLDFTDSDGTYSYEGKWGGQFYGAEAEAVIGTLGGAGGGTPDGGDAGFRSSFVGAFGAYKASPATSP